MSTPQTPGESPPSLRVLSREAVEVPQEALVQLASFYEAGQMLKAYAWSQQFGPLWQWQGCRAANWAGRLAAHLGGNRLASVIHWRNYRRHRIDPAAAAYYANVVLERSGPLAAMDFLETIPDPPGDADDDSGVYLASLRCETALAFRDFETAGAILSQAQKRYPAERWLRVTQSRLWERQDRYEAALAEAQEVLLQSPRYRPALHQAAHLLNVLDRDDEALALLREAANALEIAPILAQLAVMEMEMELFEDALLHFDRYAQLAPLADRHHARWLNCNRVAVACRTRDWARALEIARAIDEPYYRELAARLENPESPRQRVQLRVPFVRQHHMTCAPATLSALSRFWSRPAEHLELAEEICYDGTPAHSERAWAESHGWIAREFTVTWEAACQLVDRGIPFTLTTVETTSSHLQAVVGYDALRQSLLLRDPFFYYTSEALCPKFLDRYAAWGPRGMALVPADRPDLLEGLTLPDAELHDTLHRVHQHLQDHARDLAEAAYAELARIAPDHRLTHTAGRSLAQYDTNAPSLAKHIDALLKSYPDDGNLLLSRIGCVVELGGRREHLDFLEKICSRPTAEPVFEVRLAWVLREDQRQLPGALERVRRAMRIQPGEFSFLKTYADLLWDLKECERATQLYRLGACAEDMREPFPRSYFLAARHLKRTEEALAFLRSRVQRHGAKSPMPALTLFEALMELHRHSEAMSVLEEARQRRPDDGTLLLALADAHGRLGHFDEAERALAQAKPKAARAEWLRRAATLASYRNNRLEALDHWRALLLVEPLAFDAHRSAAYLLAETKGWSAAIEFLDESRRRFPRHCGLLRLRAELLGREAEDLVIPALRELIDVNGADDWAWRELALRLGASRQFNEALVAVEEAIRLQPNHPYGYATRGQLHLDQGDLAAARHDFKRALELSVDTGVATERLLECCQTQDERRAAVQFVEEQLVRQTVFGEGLFAFREMARGVMEPGETLARLREALEARQDLWEAWVQVLAQLLDMDRFDEALELAGRALESFPFTPRIWLERARVHEARLDWAPAIADLERALALNPAYSDASQILSQICLRQDDFQRAEHVLEQAAVQDPFNAFLRGGIADIQWKTGRREAALETLRHALRLEPGYPWAWATLREWAGELEQPDLALDMARDLARRRPGEVRSWIMLAECLAGKDEKETLEAVDKAVALNPRSVEALDLRARALTWVNRFDDALKACRPIAFKQPPPALLLREAWVEAQRGNYPKAIADLRALLKDHPSQYRAWEWLTELCRQTGDLDGAIHAAEQMHRLAPRETAPLGYLADLLRQKDDVAAARRHLEQAFALDPTYAFAGLNLFDLAMNERDYDRAASVLERLRRHVGGELVDARAIQLDSARSLEEPALRQFEALCRRPTRDGWSLAASMDALVHAGWKNRAARIIRRLFRSEDELNPWLGEVWIKHQFGRRRYSHHRLLKRLMERGEIGRRMLLAYLDAIGAREAAHGRGVNKSTLRLHFRFLMKRYGAWLHQDDLGWGKVGYVYASFERYRPLVKWLADWRQRPQVESWMLYNLTLGLQTAGRHAETLAITRHALMLRQSPDIYHSFAALGALEEAIQGDPTTAQALLDGLPEGKLPFTDEALRRYAQAILRAGKVSVDGADEEARLDQVRQDLLQSDLGRRPYQLPPYLRACYTRAVARAADLAGRPSLRWWGKWNYRGGHWMILSVWFLIVAIAAARLARIM